jgi:hypothetical protein
MLRDQAGWVVNQWPRVNPALNARTESRKSEPLEAGFAKGDAEFLDLFIQNFRGMANMRWQ